MKIKPLAGAAWLISIGWGMLLYAFLVGNSIAQEPTWNTRVFEARCPVANHYGLKMETNTTFCANSVGSWAAALQTFADGVTLRASINAPDTALYFYAFVLGSGAASYAYANPGGAWLVTNGSVSVVAAIPDVNRHLDLWCVEPDTYGFYWTPAYVTCRTGALGIATARDYTTPDAVKMSADFICAERLGSTLVSVVGKRVSSEQSAICTYSDDFSVAASMVAINVDAQVDRDAIGVALMALWIALGIGGWVVGLRMGREKQEGWLE